MSAAKNADAKTSAFLDAEEAATKLAGELEELAGAVRASRDAKATLAEATSSMQALGERVRSVAESSRESIEVIKEASGPRIVDEIGSVSRQAGDITTALAELRTSLASSTRRLTYMVAVSIVLGIAAIVVSLVR